jgi:tRNA pseudouridine38-40 synthase
MKIALLIEYDGKAFCGWQVQPGERSVQGELEKAVTQITGARIAIQGAGRTDTGVHAYGMVAHADLPENYASPLGRLAEGINATSGYDVVVKDIREVPDDFHARFSALSREYRFTIIKGKTAIWRGLSWPIWGALDEELLHQAATKLIGIFDFTSLSKQTEDVSHYQCNVSVSEWKIDGDRLIYTIKANRFVRGMVRALVGAMVEVGKGKLHIEDFQKLLTEPKELDRARYIAPPEGLILWRVEYPEKCNLW